MKTKKIITLAILTALYVALSALMKISFIGNISLDLGYIAFVVALMSFKYAGIAVGVLGCALESLLFSAYGFSISWAVGNLIVGLVFAIGASKIKYNKYAYMAFALIGCLLGIGVVKTGIECVLYNIPLLVKLPKNLVAMAVDTITMCIGILIFNEKRLDKLNKTWYN